MSSCLTHEKSNPPDFMDNPFGITREEVLDLAARKLVDAYCGDPDLSDTATRLIREKVEAAFTNGLNARIGEFLTAEMQKLLSQEIVPVDIWGQREGTPTTIRAQLAERARVFWSVKVDDQGRESSYGGTERSKRLMSEILQDQFAKAVKDNADAIVGAFKTALKDDAVKLVTEHIDKLINVKSR